jgi:hypothetical protein
MQELMARSKEEKEGRKEEEKREEEEEEKKLEKEKHETEAVARAGGRHTSQSQRKDL